ncbi:ABC transporter ATP-binding protein [Dactylosporangium fulvum]|uniref:ATP-binding cassette domain-containing protein n=1 Tax=Dactylosporangium fulvum TaxID=53359 RepID=A0ABY5VSS9_9ACTN|nr:ATP-binding cassette domain-containing protein [Dactylosporangium fulvum]UWP80255.1 ATP-binding cassette domain-containing protein [Dactylosporangium fulvum]
MLSLDGVSVAYRHGATALQGLSLRVDSGEVVAVLGPNGAGKTTMLRAATGLLPLYGARITRGDVLFRGRSIVRRSAKSLVSDGIAQVMEGRRLFKDLTVEENLLTGAATTAGRARRRQLVSDVMREIVPGDIDPQRIAGLLSGGQQQLVAIGRALMAQPALLVLDEPSLGLAPVALTRVREVLKRVVDTGMTMLLVEQDAALALALAQRVYVMQAGTVVFEGTPDELRSSSDLAALYLGGHMARRRKAVDQ